MDVIAALAPVVLLVVLMTSPRGLPSHVALPLVAVLMYLLKLTYFENGPNLVHATVLQGLIKALTPISIVFGAILLFKTMEASGAMATIRQWLHGITRNPVGQLMVVGWAFVFLIEGASGFGTPAALAAPLLVGMGFPPVRVAVVCLVMDTVPVTFGAVGTPIWFGLEGVVAGQERAAAEATLLAVGWRAAVLNAAAALVVPPVALRLLVPWSTIRRNLVFVYASILACVVPYVLVSFQNYAFPALAGGLVGLLVSAFLAKKGIGLETSPEPNRPSSPAATSLSTATLLKALFPLWGTVLVLILTRVSAVGLKPLLTATEPSVTWSLGTLMDLRVSAALRVDALRILGESSVNDRYEVLYVPALVPFVLIAAVTAALYRVRWGTVRETAVTSGRQMVRPVVALLGALVLVQLLMLSEQRPAGTIPASTAIIGASAASALGGVWQYFAVWLGALGSFFSGSATISNLTFGAVQARLASQAGLPLPDILALQSAGAALGNMVCIHNIVAVSSILGLEKAEGTILKRAALPMVVYGLVATIGGVIIMRVV